MCKCRRAIIVPVVIMSVFDRPGETFWAMPPFTPAKSMLQEQWIMSGRDVWCVNLGGKLRGNYRRKQRLLGRSLRSVVRAVRRVDENVLADK